MTTTMENITVSVPSRLVSVVEEIVKEEKTNRSRVVSRCLENMARERMIKLMEEGYREMANENRVLAEQSLSIALETWPREDIDPQ